MQSLSEEWRTETASDDELCRDRLILKYLPLVKYVLGKISIYLPQHLDEEDLLEAGIVGLIDAAEKFDRTRQVQFKTYAIPRIRGSILDELRAQDWIPRSARKKAHILEAAFNKLRDRWDRDPTLDEMAEEMGVTPDEVNKLLCDVSFASLMSLETVQSQDSDEPSTIGSTLANPRSVNPAHAYEFEEEKGLLADAMAELPEPERLVITLYYFEDLLLKEIGEIMGLSESRISQLHSKAVFVLRSKMKRAMTVHSGA